MQKWVFFDADETLYTFSRPLGQIYADSLQHHGLTVEPEIVEAKLRKIWKELVPDYLNGNNSFLTNSERELQFWRTFVRCAVDSLGSVKDFESFFLEIYELFADAGTRKLREGVAKLLAALRVAQYKVGVLSNHDERMIRVIDGLKLRDSFDLVLPSPIVGYKKPSQKFFERACELANCRSSEALYIGNDFELDYQGARAAGWHAIWYNSRRMATPPGVSAVVDFDTVLEALKHLPDRP